MVAADAVMIPVALWSALVLKFDTFSTGIGGSGWLYAVAVVAALPVFARLGLYRAVIRFVGPAAMFAVAVGVTLSVVLLGVYDRTIGTHEVPLSAFAIYWALALLYVGGSRFCARHFLTGHDRGAVRVAIYGAGEAGAQLAAALKMRGEHQPVAYIDDDRKLQGSYVNGIEVFDTTELPALIKRAKIDRILLALPRASRHRRREILRNLESLHVHLQTVPEVSDIVAGRAKVDDIRDVDVADLLGRDAVPPNATLLDACIRGRSVMVTGAGGSIGSELCRQILQLEPVRLVLLEMSELALYSVERELRQVVDREQLDVKLVPLLGNAYHKHRVREVLQTYHVQTVYHAAAYKHVPIVETNMIQGVHNNVFSTLYAAEAALEAGVETFVLISTDKAVNPTNVLGATKRLAELVLQGLHRRGSPHTRFCMVRFGNVLESSGSVVPLFREQIRSGGPVTVTHPEVIRYFMTIPEAAQLVLQAGSMGNGGDVFVLDMGKPIRIDHLARHMVRLMGLTVRDEDNPDGDIEIEYTGLRPAEKLYEELLIGNNVAGTEHPMILRATEHSLPWESMQRILDDLLTATRLFDCDRALAILRAAVAEYAPAPQIQDLVWAKRTPPMATPIALPDATKVADFATHRARQGQQLPN
ncbi:MAG TPA: nucleoside-diphosphate sugar epimerase/dehydratase [Steroidobacteraceae bacterium]|nr:nucleoside-diphosphate sugar epimerase/dehydratase [Steroidobacteraceae bacterium]